MADTPEKGPSRRIPGSLPARGDVDIASVAAHYDKGDRIIRLFIDPETLMYSCALWTEGVESLAQAQAAKVDHSLAKLDLKPDQLLLDIGSGYGYVLRRASEVYGVKGIGLNLSQAQVDYSQQAGAKDPGLEYRFQGWEQFEEPVDAIISIGAFEQFGRRNYPEFFRKTKAVLPQGGRMLLHTIVFDQIPDRTTHRLKAREFAKYAHFIHKNIFPNGELPYPTDVPDVIQTEGFKLLDVEVLKNSEGESHYIRTLDTWAANLEVKYNEAVARIDKQTYQIFMRYLTQSAFWFREKAIDVRQYLLQAT